MCSTSTQPFKKRRPIKPASQSHSLRSVEAYLHKQAGLRYEVVLTSRLQAVGARPRNLDRLLSTPSQFSQTPPRTREILDTFGRRRSFQRRLQHLHEVRNYSPDGRWVSYVSVPEMTLWVSRADGSERHQVDFLAKEIEVPRWSPDGRRIAFMARLADRPLRIYNMVPGWQAGAEGDNGAALLHKVKIYHRVERQNESDYQKALLYAYRNFRSSNRTEK